MVFLPQNMPVAYFEWRLSALSADAIVHQTLLGKNTIIFEIHTAYSWQGTGTEIKPQKSPQDMEATSYGQ
ncbi:MAG: hypothetical protein J6P45_04210 [Lachnospiraceae bacterium]|nr:hypothetical protein [Lachnospiraceae bacterium]